MDTWLDTTVMLSGSRKCCWMYWAACRIFCLFS